MHEIHFLVEDLQTFGITLFIIFDNLVGKKTSHYERVTGRKGRGFQKEEIGCKCQIFFLSLLSGRRKQTSVIFFSPSLYKFKEVFLKILCCHNDTCFHLNLTSFKP